MKDIEKKKEDYGQTKKGSCQKKTEDRKTKARNKE